MRPEAVSEWLRRWGWNGTVVGCVAHATGITWYLKVPCEGDHPQKVAKAMRTAWRGYLAQWKRTKKLQLQE